VYHDTILILARIVQAGMSPQPDSGVDDILGAVSVLFKSKAKGVDLVPDADDGAGGVATYGHLVFSFCYEHTDTTFYEEINHTGAG
jgi:hypothetical protein